MYQRSHNMRRGQNLLKARQVFNVKNLNKTFEITELCTELYK